MVKGRPYRDRKTSRRYIPSVPASFRVKSPPVATNPGQQASGPVGEHPQRREDLRPAVYLVENDQSSEGLEGE